ncbi:glycogen synthase [Pedobacter sp. NJ-S-72]
MYLVYIAGLTDRDKVYGYEDDTERFLAYQIATLDWITQWEHRPDVIHCHDHHTGLVPFMTGNCEKYKSLRNIPTVLTIHNAQYQGQFGWDKLHYLPAFDLWRSGLLEWKKDINPLASAIKCAWKVTTVSPSYLEEISYNANGLESLFASERGKSSGILNGIDNEVWDPQKDPMLEKTYNIRTVENGKKANKTALCDVFFT